MNIKTNILSVLALIALRGSGEAQTLALLSCQIVKLNATVATLEAQIAASNVTVNKELQAGVTLQNEIKSYLDNYPSKHQSRHQLFANKLTSGSGQLTQSSSSPNYVYLDMADEFGVKALNIVFSRGERTHHKRVRSHQ